MLKRQYVSSNKNNLVYSFKKIIINFTMGELKLKRFTLSFSLDKHV
jgi:hypothetical protein